MKTTLFALTLAATFAVIPGCLLLAGAAIGAGVIYATGEDTAEVRVDASADTAYAAARDELTKRGTVSTADPVAKKLEARVGSSDVTVTVAPEPESGHAKIAVKARKIAGVGPDMDTANDVAFAVVKRTQ